MLDQPAFTRLSTKLTIGDALVELKAGYGRTAAQVATAVPYFKEALQTSCLVLTQTPQVTLETVAVIEETAESAVTLWVRATTDGLGNLAPDARTNEALLKFVGRAILTIVDWLDGQDRSSLTDLQRALRVLAWGTAATSDAHPTVPTSAQLIHAVMAWQGAKERLQTGDSAKVTMQHGSAILDLEKGVRSKADLLGAGKSLTRVSETIFIVEAPDYQLNSEWTLRYGTSRVKAAARRGTSLDGFYRRELDIRPGDALHCMAQYDTLYGPDYEVLNENVTIIDVLDVIPAPTADAIPLQNYGADEVAPSLDNAAPAPV